MCDYYNNFYEPSEADTFFDEMKESFKGILLDDVKSEIKRLKEENYKLEEENKEYRKKEREIAEKERTLEYQEKELKEKVEKDFYDKTIEEVFARYLEDCGVWFAGYVPHKKPKCKFCNAERKLTATFPNGEIVIKNCDCSGSAYKYEPIILRNRRIEFRKSFKPFFNGIREMYAKTFYEPKDVSYLGDKSYAEFVIENVFDNFDDEVKKFHKNKKNGENLAFRNKEACQAYCDWLNKLREE